MKQKYSEQDEEERRIRMAMLGNPIAMAKEKTEKGNKDLMGKETNERKETATLPLSLLSSAQKQSSTAEISTKHRVDTINVYDSARMIDEYQEYIKNLKQNRFITGINEIDKRIRGVAGGEVLTIIARSGSFKTAKSSQKLYPTFSMGGRFFLNRNADCKPCRALS